MADVSFFPSFQYRWAQSGPVETLQDAQYQQGWGFIGSTPPSVEQFNAVQQITDQKLSWLFGQLKAAADLKGVDLSAEDMGGLVAILAATAPNASTTARGLIRIATALEALALESDQIAITPATLAAVLAEQGSIITVPYADLPGEDIGRPIWVPEFQDIWTWTSSAYYTGYRSPLCGKFEWGTTEVPRPFEVHLIGQTELKANEPRVWAWAQETGRVVSAGSWQPRRFQFADIDADTFRYPDLQDVFIRATGTDADTANARALGTWQADQMQRLVGTINAGAPGSNTPLFSSGSGAFTHSGGSAGANNITAGAATRYVTAAFDSSNSPGARTSATTSGETRSQAMSLPPTLHV